MSVERSSIQTFQDYDKPFVAELTFNKQYAESRKPLSAVTALGALYVFHGNDGLQAIDTAYLERVGEGDRLSLDQLYNRMSGVLGQEKANEFLLNQASVAFGACLPVLDKGIWEGGIDMGTLAALYNKGIDRTRIMSYTPPTENFGIKFPEDPMPGAINSKSLTFMFEEPHKYLPPAMMTFLQDTRAILRFGEIVKHYKEIAPEVITTVSARRQASK